MKSIRNILLLIITSQVIFSCSGDKKLLEEGNKTTYLTKNTDIKIITDKKTEPATSKIYTAGLTAEIMLKKIYQYSDDLIHAESWKEKNKLIIAVKEEKQMIISLFSFEFQNQILFDGELKITPTPNQYKFMKEKDYVLVKQKDSLFLRQISDEKVKKVIFKGEKFTHFEIKERELRIFQNETLVKKFKFYRMGELPGQGIYHFYE